MEGRGRNRGLTSKGKPRGGKEGGEIRTRRGKEREGRHSWRPLNVFPLKVALEYAVANV